MRSYAKNVCENGAHSVWSPCFIKITDKFKRSLAWAFSAQVFCFVLNLENFLHSFSVLYTYKLSAPYFTEQEGFSWIFKKQEINQIK